METRVFIDVKNPGNPVFLDFFLWILRVSQTCPKAPHIRISPSDQLHECLESSSLESFEVPGIESVAGIAFSSM
jgi:hypothetical protein